MSRRMTGRCDPDPCGAIEPSDDDDGAPSRGRVRVKVVTRGVAATLLALGLGVVSLVESPQPHLTLSDSCEELQRVVRTLAIAPDRTAIYGFTSDGSLVIWNPGWNPGRVRVVANRGLLPVAFSPDVLTMAVASHDGSVALRDLVAGQQRSRIPMGAGFVSALAFSRDGTTLALADRAGVRLVAAPSGRPLAGSPLDLPGVTSLAFAPDGRTLAVGDRQGLIRLWNLAKGGPLNASRAHRTAVHSLAFADDGEFLASMSHEDRVARIWQASGTRLVAEFDARSCLQAMTFAPRTRMLATASRDGVVRIWDAEAGGRCRVLQEYHDPVTALAFSSDGRRLACGGLGWIRLNLVGEMTRPIHR